MSEDKIHIKRSRLDELLRVGIRDPIKRAKTVEKILKRQFVEDVEYELNKN